MSSAKDHELEAELQRLQANAPRLKPEDIDAVIVGTTYTKLPSEKVLVCELTLRNKYTVRGESAVVSIANYRQEVGERISKERAYAKIWELEGYLLQQRLYEQALASVGGVAVPATAQRTYTRNDVQTWRDDAFKTALSLIERIKLIDGNPDHDFVRGQLDMVTCAIDGLISKDYEQAWYLASALRPTFNGENLPLVLGFEQSVTEQTGYYGTGPEQWGPHDQAPGFFTDNHQPCQPFVWRFAD
jgi:hypothetical protein